MVNETLTCSMDRFHSEGSVPVALRFGAGPLPEKQVSVAISALHRSKWINETSLRSGRGVQYQDWAAGPAYRAPGYPGYPASGPMPPLPMGMNQFAAQLVPFGAQYMAPGYPLPCIRAPEPACSLRHMRPRDLWLALPVRFSTAAPMGMPGTDVTARSRRRALQASRRPSSRLGLATRSRNRPGTQRPSPSRLQRRLWRK